MIDDIFKAIFGIENPSGASSFSIYYRQTADLTSSDNDPRKLAEGIALQTVPELRGMMSNEFEASAVRVYQVYSDADDPRPPYTAWPVAQIGLIASAGAPSNICLNLGLVQNQLPQRQNGRIFVPGIPEANMSAGIITQAYADTEVLAFANALLTPITAVTDTGIWEAGIISSKLLNAAPPAKDWATAFHSLVDVVRNPLTSFQRRRTTRVLGPIIT